MKSYDLFGYQLSSMLLASYMLILIQVPPALIKVICDTLLTTETTAASLSLSHSSSSSLLVSEVTMYIYIYIGYSIYKYIYAVVCTDRWGSNLNDHMHHPPNR